jgi:dTDP-glucose pyrophosphorylase
MGKHTLLILAAGMGSRYGGLKQIDRLGPGGETIIDYSIYDAIGAGFRKIIFVIRKSIEKDFKEVIIDKYKNKDKITIDYVLQETDVVPAGFCVPSQREKPWGTAHAVWMAKDKIDDFFAVINGDDFYGNESFSILANYLNTLSLNDTHCCSMVAYRLAHTLSENGSVSRGICTVDENHNLVQIEEYTKLKGCGTKIRNENEEQTPVELLPDTPVSMNFWGFHPSVFTHIENCFVDFLQKNSQDLKAEFYIPFVVDDLIKAGKIQVKVLETASTWYGITYQEDRQYVRERFKEMVQANIYPPVLW